MALSRDVQACCFLPLSNLLSIGCAAIPLTIPQTISINHGSWCHGHFTGVPLRGVEVGLAIGIGMISPGTVPYADVHGMGAIVACTGGSWVGEAGVAAGGTGESVGGTGVGGAGVSVGADVRVCVGGAGIAAGGAGESVGGTAVGGAGVSVGVDVGVCVGGGGVAVGGTGVSVGGAGVPVAVGVGVRVGWGVEQGDEALEAVEVRPFSVQTRSLPSKSTPKAASGQYGVRPGPNAVGWPRSCGSGENLFSGPIGIVTVMAFSFL